jgi:hypothetical protein
VAHGTGGIVVRYAIATNSSLAVEDVVTLGTPHAGSAALAKECVGRPVCQELDPATETGKAMIVKLATPEFANPQGAGGTDWTAIAAAKDELVTPESALGMSTAHETTFQDPKLTHESMLHDI